MEQLLPSAEVSVGYPGRRLFVQLAPRSIE
jgi:hypothetical protein